MTKDEAIVKIAEGWAGIISSPNLKLRREDFVTSKEYNQYRAYLFKLKMLKGLGDFPIEEEKIESFKEHFSYFMKYHDQLYKDMYHSITSIRPHISLKYAMCMADIKEWLLPPNTDMVIYNLNNDYYVEVSEYGMPFRELNTNKKSNILSKIKTL